jgi:hypothetical protein
MRPPLISRQHVNAVCRCALQLLPNVLLLGDTAYLTTRFRLLEADLALTGFGRTSGISLVRSEYLLSTRNGPSDEDRRHPDLAS